MKGPAHARPALTVIDGPDIEHTEWSWFCGHCAAPSPGGGPPRPAARVCRSCGLGLLLESPRGLVPHPSDTFLVVDGSLLVQGLSRRGEALLGVREDVAVNRPVTGLLVPADAECAEKPALFTAIHQAVHGATEPAQAFVRPWNTFGVRVRARIGACGPPRAALVVLEWGPRRGLHVARDEAPGLEPME